MVDSSCLYCFVRNEPTNLIDRTGQQAIAYDPFYSIRQLEQPVMEAYNTAAKAVENFAKEVVEGDFYEGETTWAGVGGNVGVGLIPVVGQIADVRDTFAAIKKVSNKPTSWSSWAGLGMAAVAWVPGIGDAIKGAAKVEKKIVSSAGKILAKTEKSATKIEKAVEKPLEQSVKGEQKIAKQAEEALVESTHGAEKGAKSTAKDALAETIATGGTKPAEKVTVYRSLNEAKKVHYVGITNDVARRQAEHLTSKGIIIEPLLENLSRQDAKAVEQALIQIHGLGKSPGGTLLNKINSIAKKNPQYAAQVERGYELLKTVGYK